VSQKRVWADLVDGSFSLDVIPSDDAGWNPGPVYYLVEQRLAGLPFTSFLAYLPGPGPIDLALLVSGDVDGYPVWAYEGDHGMLTGLSDDDHPEYARVAVSPTPPASPRIGTVWVPSP
jgi:hypothetical protein